MRSMTQAGFVRYSGKPSASMATLSARITDLRSDQLSALQNAQFAINLNGNAGTGLTGKISGASA